MTRKDYILFADMMSQFLDSVHMTADMGLHAEAESQLDGAVVMVNRLCDMFSSDNPRFDEVKFREACGIDKILVH